MPPSTAAMTGFAFSQVTAAALETTSIDRRLLEDIAAHLGRSEVETRAVASRLADMDTSLRRRLTVTGREAPSRAPGPFVCIAYIVTSGFTVCLSGCMLLCCTLYRWVERGFSEMRRMPPHTEC